MGVLKLHTKGLKYTFCELHTYLPTYFVHFGNDFPTQNFDHLGNIRLHFYVPGYPRKLEEDIFEI